MPLALRLGFLLSVAISSCRYALGSAQSHSVMTTFRSTPCGLGGVGGNSPAATRSVQSANIGNARSGPSCARPLIMLLPACPDSTRPAQAAVEELKLPRLLGISRVALSPI